ncbi:hypothetical protein Golob_026452, partial [Gossypium lobatum]|nr:hypothetical protein [Gossypium lobatum]
YVWREDLLVIWIFSSSRVGRALILQASSYFPENLLLIGKLLARMSKAMDFNEVGDDEVKELMGLVVKQTQKARIEIDPNDE